MIPQTPKKNIAYFVVVSSALGSFCAQLRAQNAVCVRAQTFDIEYTVAREALPLQSVNLWYTSDGGLNWVEYGQDEDRVSPIRFHAPSEGLFGFFFVLTNASGASSATPAPSTAPQQWALVDFTAPVVQLHQARLSSSFGEQVVQIRWTAVDSQLLPRPIDLEFSTPGSDKRQRLTDEPIANTGRFDWRVPKELTGAVSIRVAATDRGGHRTESDAITVELGASTNATADAANLGLGASGLRDDSALAGSERARDMAARLFEEARGFGERGQFDEAVRRLREAVKLDPRMTAAFAEMGTMFYRLGDLERAVSAYDLVLQREPNSRDALRGVARVNQQQRNYEAAADRLRTVLRYYPTDAEVWVQLGDIAVFQGDEVRARECYTRATQIDPNAPQAIADARQRLALMSRMNTDPVAAKP